MRNLHARNPAVVALTALLLSCQPGGQGTGATGASSSPFRPSDGVTRPGGAAITCTGTPPAPTNLTADASAPNVVSLAWDEDGTPEYVVYRSLDAGGPYEAIGTVAGAVGFEDATVSGGSTYHYVVRGMDCEESPASNEAVVTATGDCTLPPAFAGVAAVTNAAASTCGLEVSWPSATPACGGTITYEVFRSRTAGFTPGAANRIASDVAGTTFSDAVNLAGGTRYHYVVRAAEVGARRVVEQNTVERSSVPTGVITVGVDWFDDFDGNRPSNAAAWWTTLGTNLLSLVGGCHWQSSNTAYKFGALGVCGGTYTSSADAWLVLGGNGTLDPAINGFAFSEGSSARLSFYHWFNFENNYDGATLYYSTTGAAGPWIMVNDTVSGTQPYVSAGGYTGTAQGRRSWTNIYTPADGALRGVTVNLDALGGQTAWFAIRFTTDSSVNREGHYLDDVRIEASDVAACATATAPPGPPVAYAIDLAPSAEAGAPLPFVATAIDAWEQAVGAYAGTAAVTSSDPQALIPPPVTFASGVATGEVTFGTAGVQSISMTDGVEPGFLGAASALVTPGAPAALAIVGQPTDTVAGASIAPEVAVAITDAFGNRVPASVASVTLGIGDDAGGGTLGGTTTVDAIGGVASFGDLTIERAGGGYTLVAAADALTSATTAPFDVLPDVPASIGVMAQPTTAQAGVAIAPSVEIGVYDRFGNLTPGSASVSLRIGANPGGSWLAGTSTVEAVDGVATFADLWLNRAGAGYTLLASTPAFAPVETVPFDVLPGAPYAVEVTAYPSAASAGVAISPAVTGAVVDRYGNVATQYGGPVYAALLGGAGASLLGTPTVAAAAGIATFADLAVDRAGTGYTLGLAAPGLLMGTSTPFDVSAGPATHYALVGPPASATASVEVPFAIRALDAVGNVAPGYAGTATITSTDPALTAPGDVTFDAGAAEVRVTFRTVGIQTLTLTDAADPTFNVTAEVVVTAFPQPTVQVTSPLDGSELSGVVTVTADGAVASGTTLTGIAIRVDGVEVASGTELPFAAQWDTAGASGPHALTAVISDAAGNVVQSSPVIVTVARADEPASSGGCSCGTGGGGEAALLFGLAAVVLRRRRKAG